MTATKQPGRQAGDRLAVVLRLRRLDENRARLALAAALARESEVRGRLDAVRAEHEAACATVAGLLGEAVDAASLAEATTGIEVIERRRGRLVEELEGAAGAVAAARAGLADATRRRGAVERLWERRRAERRRRVERRMERELTEIVLVRHAWALAAANW